mgnify:CR=1 FL=1
MAEKKEVFYRFMLPLVVHANEMVLGRLASNIAQILRGKHKPMFTPHLDTGDFVVVINADKVRLTGAKADKKQYFRHTGYIGGEKFIPFRTMLEERIALDRRRWLRNTNPRTAAPGRRA